MKGVSLPLQTSLTLPELPRKTPPLRGRKFDSPFVVAGSCGEVLGLDGRCELVAECGFAPDWWVGCVSYLWENRLPEEIFRFSIDKERKKLYNIRINQRKQ